MRGYTNRAKALLSPRDSLARVIDAINRLPFGWVGFVGATAIPSGALFINTWTGFDINPTIDFDGLIATNGLTAKVDSGTDGVWQAAFEGKMTSTTGLVRLRVNATEVFRANLDTTLRTFVSIPFNANVGDVLTWEMQTTNTSWAVSTGARMSAYRLGFQP